MGQANSKRRVVAHSLNIETKKNRKVSTCKTLNPLHYINPVQYHFEEPDIFNENDYPNRTFSHDQKENLLFDPEIIYDQPKEEQIIYKKVEVKWNKFIKMKPKNFLADYKMLGEIGQGGFGCVYKVMKKGIGILRAAKKINKNSLKNEEHQNLLAEMAIMMHMDHPNIAKLYEVYDQPTHYVMILELCDGGELLEKIVNRELEEEETKGIMIQILSALNYMHSKGIVHRDIKPENMLFEESTKLIKIIDFGIATKIQPQQMLTNRVGTPFFIAPEVLAKNYNEKCDIWSLGIVLYMIIYHMPPFQGDSSSKVMELVVKSDIFYKDSTNFKFSALSIDFLKKMLNKNPKLRFCAAEALSHKWLSEYSTDIDIKKKDETLARIAKFHFKNRLEAVVHTYIVSHLLTSEERHEMLEIFRYIDKDKNGTISMDELKLALEESAISKLSEGEIAEVQEYLDTNCSGAVDYTEFLVGAIDNRIKMQEKHLDRAFRYFDIDNNGEITFEEVTKFLKDEATTIDEIKELFMRIDQNGDGVVSKQEFISLLKN